MRWLYFLFSILVFFFGCSTPSPYLRDSSTTRVQVEDVLFLVRHRGQRADATRIRTEFPATLKGVPSVASTAMQATAGCDVTKIRGEATQLVGVLACDTPQASVAFPSPRIPTCDAVDAFAPAGGVTGYLEAECR